MYVRYLIRTLAPIFASGALLLAGCRDSAPTAPVDPAIETQETSIFLTPGQSRTIAVNVAPSGAAWTAESDDSGVASVTRAAGSVTITAANVGFATVHLTLTQYPWVWTQVVVEVTAQ